MLLDYPGHVKVCIDGIAASAASMIAMAGEVVAMSPVSMLMILNPAALAVGDADELGQARTADGSRDLDGCACRYQHGLCRRLPHQKRPEGRRPR